MAEVEEYLEKDTQTVEEDDFKRSYSFFYDFPAEQQVYEVKDNAHEEIFDRITQDIFNDTLAKW